MNGSQGSAFIDEMKELINFLKNLWGILGGISVFFPLSNVFTGIIPLTTFPEGPYAHFTPAFITSLSTLITIFVIFITFIRRDIFFTTINVIKMQRQAKLNFLQGILFLFLYFIMYVATNNSGDFFGFYDDSLYYLFLEIFLIVLYSLFFACITKAFMVLGMIEFYRVKRH